MKDIIIKLTESEMAIADLVAHQRKADNDLHPDRTPAWGQEEGRTLEDDYHGLCCEIATASHFNLYWSGTVGNFRAPDVGGLIQVRGTPAPASYTDTLRRLLLHPTDKDHEPFVLARHQLPEIFIVGWMFAREGKKQEYWGSLNNRKKGDCYRVPNGKLRPIAGLEEWVREQRR